MQEVDVHVSFSPVRYDEKEKQLFSIGGQLVKKICINIELIDTARRLLMLVYEDLRGRLFPGMGWAERMLSARIGLIGTRDGAHFILSLEDRLENFGRFFYAVSPANPEFFEIDNQMDRFFYSEKMYCQHHLRQPSPPHVESNAGLEHVLRFFPIKELFKPVRIIEKQSRRQCVVNNNLPAPTIYARDSDFYVIGDEHGIRYACSGNMQSSSLLSS